jgi:formyl-CoA transferase
MWKARMNTGDPRMQDRQARLQYADEIDAPGETWTEKHTRHEAMERLAAAGVPCGAVLDTGEVLEDDDLRERGMLVTVEHPTRGAFTMPANPIRLGDSPTEVRPAPLLGQHNADVYGALLGIGADDLAALERDGVI